MGCERSALLVVAALALLCSQCLANIDFSFTGEFPEYTLNEEIVTVVFTVKAPPLQEQPPLSWTAVLDRSASMAGRKIDLLKDTTSFMIDKLAEADGSNHLGLVTYSTDVETLATVQPVGFLNAGFLKGIVNTIVAAGQTFLSGGLARGLQQQASAPGGKVKAVYLFTDGLPNVGATSTPDIVDQISSILDQSLEPISISTFGFGSDLDFGLLQSISAVGGGDTYIIDNENDIPAAFGSALGLLLSLSAQEINVVFTPEPGSVIVSVQAGGMITFLEDGSVRIVFDNLSAEEMRDILIEVRVPPAVAVVEDQNVFTVGNTYIDAPTMQRVTVNPTPYAIKRTTIITPLPPAPKVEETKIRFKTAEVLGEARKKRAEGDSEGANAVIEGLVAETKESPLADDPVIQNILSDISTAQEILGDTDMGQEPQAELEVAQLEQTLRTQRSTATRDRFRSSSAVDTPLRKKVREEAAAAVLGPLTPPPLDAELPPATLSPPPQQAVIMQPQGSFIPSIAPSPAPSPAVAAVLATPPAASPTSAPGMEDPVSAAQSVPSKSFEERRQSLRDEAVAEALRRITGEQLAAELVGANPAAADAAVDSEAMDTAAVDSAAVGPAADDPAAVDPAAVDPVAVDPAVVDPAVVDPVAVDPVAVDPVALDPAAIDAEVEAIGTDTGEIVEPPMQAPSGVMDSLRSGIGRLGLPGRR
ncbi:hypothetical protein BSKO_08328 [Bryopsis sp. KO-2023]|nr:hypothetical protein BSKO_08328 [Bryopsis sp. KO-2023]